MKQYIKIIGILGLLVIGSLYFLPERKVGVVPLTILEKIEGKGIKERANIKSQELAKIPFIGTYTETKYGLTIEIESLRAIEGGIEIYARAWKDGKQLGFGKDGSVEWERFIIENPPVLIYHPAGTIIKNSVDAEGKSKTLRLMENPIEAVRRTFAHTIHVSGEENTQVISGKRGNTTSTFFPSLDGRLAQSIAGTAWATIRTGNASHDDPNSTNDNGGRAGADAGGWDAMTRSSVLFDSSAIDDGDTIDSATFSMSSDTESDQYNQAVVMINTDPASTSDLAVADWYRNSLIFGGGTDQATAVKDITTDWVTTGYNDFTLSATGLGNVSKTGLSKFGIALSGDQSNTEPTPSAGVAANVTVYFSEQAGTDNDPKLVVEHTGAGGEEQPIWHLFMNTLNQLAFR